MLDIGDSRHYEFAIRSALGNPHCAPLAYRKGC